MAGCKVHLLETLLFILLLMSACVPPRPEPLAPPEPTMTAISIRMNWPEPEVEILPVAVASSSSACPVSTLGYWEHISARGSYTETQSEASGPIGCRIERDSCAFKGLIGVLDPTIVFKREEMPPYDKEDILIHPAMLLPLGRLNKLVKAEWAGLYQLRITDAYDSLLEHDLGQADPGRKVSLHFEGRAVDLTTWPIDRAVYGRLCALAHCAGFDWVHNEGDHCHAELKAESLCYRCAN